jgi:putative flippase GtrA
MSIDRAISADPSPGTGWRRLWPAAAARTGAPVLGQFVKFGTVGIVNTILTLAVYALLASGLGVYYVAASGIAFTVGTINSFLLNRRWTFRGHAGGPLTPVRWFVVQGSGLLLDLFLVYALVNGARIDKLIGQVIAIAIVVVLTFFANRAWTFRMPRRSG